MHGAGQKERDYTWPKVGDLGHRVGCHVVICQAVASH